jgi:hypothetical protein
MSHIDRHAMQRSVMHRSYKKLILCYADGHRAIIYDSDHIKWLLHECDALVRIFIFTLK